MTCFHCDEPARWTGVDWYCSHCGLWTRAVNGRGYSFDVDKQGTVYYTGRRNPCQEEWIIWNYWKTDAFGKPIRRINGEHGTME